MLSVEEIFWQIDDCCPTFEPQWQQLLLRDGKTRYRPRSLCLSEIMTIMVAFHQQQYRNFKAFYLNHVRVYWQGLFPGLPSYNRFVDGMPSLLLPLCVYLKHCCGACSGISFIDATSLKVCHNRRIRRHRVFKEIAARGKTSMDWFFGFKLHLVVNERGERLNFTLTPSNVDDRKPVPNLLKPLFRFALLYSL